jgi:hypothetical protein
LEALTQLGKIASKKERKKEWYWYLSNSATAFQQQHIDCSTGNH